VPRQKRQRRLPATDAEYQQFAEQFIEAVLDRRRPWLIEYLLRYQFPPVPTEEDISSGRLAMKIHQAIGSDRLVPEWFGDALQEGNQEPLVRWAKQEAKKRKLTKDELVRLLDSTRSEKLKQSLKGFNATFRFRRGPKPHITQDQYAALLKTAELLRPAVLQLLTGSPTNNSLRETLENMHEEHPDACKFLMRHEMTLEMSLKDPKLLKRAQHRPAARARVIANALAGCEYGLAFSTSLERVREAQRRLKPPPPKFGND
jgi:hypothetical protein